MGTPSEMTYLPKILYYHYLFSGQDLSCWKKSSETRQKVKEQKPKKQELQSNLFSPWKFFVDDNLIFQFRNLGSLIATTG